MKYRNITLNGNKEYLYSLIKYSEKYTKHLEEFRRINPELSKDVEMCPKIYSELSEHQSYMIFRDNYACVGIIYIGTSIDEKNLEVKVQFDEKCFQTKNDIVALIEQLIDSLGLYFYNKESIEIELLNNIDLSQYKRFKFKKKLYDEKLTTYIYSNKGNNTLIPALITEISETESKLTSWNQYWMQQIDLTTSQDIDYDYGIDDALIEEYTKGTIPLQEIFYKANALFWLGIESKNCIRKINFSGNGAIMFDKYSKDPNGIHYNFKYNVLGEWFEFKTYDIVNDTQLTIDENSVYTRIKSKGLTNIEIFKNKENGKKKISYTGPIKNSTSIWVELVFDEDESIERCYIDFRTHKGNGKISGLYALRIIPGNIFSKFALNHIGRSGNRSFDFSHLLPTEVLNATIPGELTIELVNEIINKTIPVINQISGTKHKPFILSEEKHLEPNITETEKQIIDFIKQIKGEIPLPHLQENLEKFVEANSSKNINKKRQLKK